MASAVRHVTVIVTSSTIDKKLEITKNSKIDSKLTKKLEIILEIFEIFVNVEFFVNGR